MPQCTGQSLAGTGEPLCTFCDLLTLGQNILNLLTVTLTAAAVVLIIYGGFLVLFDLGSAERVAQGRKVIWSAVVGLVLFFGAWTITNVLFQVLVGNLQGIPWPWNQIQC